MSERASRDRILDAAEIRARAGGYNSFSFRDIANDVGVKSSSVHYHFPTKTDLAVALAERYSEMAKAHLGDPRDRSPKDAIDRVGAMFRDSLNVQKKMCLCGLFGAETEALPPPVARAVAAYFRMVIDFLDKALGADWAGLPPVAIVARFEGALILARSLEDPALFEEAVADLV